MCRCILGHAYDAWKRHLAITELFLKEKYADGTCVLVKVASEDNNSDIGTKRVTRAIFERLTNNIIDKSLPTIKDVKVKTIKTQRF